MKAIISHDIDHITVWEHWSDGIIPKYLARTNIEYVTGKISLNEYVSRHGDFFTNKWQNIRELVAFNKQQNVPNSFFIAVANGLGLSYSLANSTFWIQELQRLGCEVGLHGIAYESIEKIQQEKKLFQSLSGQSTFGIRMHYVRKTNQTLELLSEAGYSYDSTEHDFKNPYKKKNMWEFPFQFMDGWLIEKSRRWQTESLNQAKENTKALLDKVYENKLSYIGIDFHDRYFSKTHQTWLDWYMWIIDYLKQNGIQCVNFKSAIEELERNAETNKASDSNTVFSS